MTEYRYTQCFADATEVLLHQCGADIDYIKGGHSYYTVESHVRLLAEAKLGDALYVTAQLLPSDGKRIHSFLLLVRASDDTLLSTYESVMLHVSLKEKRAVPPPPSIIEKLTPLLEAHSSLPMPEAAGTLDRGEAGPRLAAPAIGRSNCEKI